MQTKALRNILNLYSSTLKNLFFAQSFLFFCSQFSLNMNTLTFIKKDSMIYPCLNTKDFFPLGLIPHIAIWIWFYCAFSFSWAYHVLCNTYPLPTILENVCEYWESDITECSWSFFTQTNPHISQLFRYVEYLPTKLKLLENQITNDFYNDIWYIGFSS